MNLPKHFLNRAGHEYHWSIQYIHTEGDSKFLSVRISPLLHTMMSPSSASSSSSSLAAAAAAVPLLSPRNSSSSRSDHERRFTDADDDDAESLDLEALSPGALGSPPPPYNSQNEKSSPRHNRKQPTVILNNLTRRPRLIALVGVILSLIAFATFAVVHVSSPLETKADVVPSGSVDNAKSTLDSVMPDTEAESGSSPYPKEVLGAPTDSFRGANFMHTRRESNNMLTSASLPQTISALI